MLARSPAAIAILAASLLGACAPRSSFEGPTGRMIDTAARAHGVPADLIAAVAHVEGGLRLAPIREIDEDELIPIAGVMELRRGRFDSLARGAALTGLPERELSRDLALGTDAGARVIADLAAARGAVPADLSTYAPVIEELSGHLHARDRARYRARVFAVLRAGGDLPARDGETITLAPHEEIPIDLTFAPPAVAPQGTPDYQGAEWFETPQANKWDPGRGGYPVTMIAIHDTEGGWDASVATLQNDTGKSVHYIIDADGSRIGQFVNESDTAWHAGNYWYNQHMVGIEHVGYASQDAYQTELYKTSAALVRDIAARNHLGPNGDGSDLDRQVLVGHQEVPNGNLIPKDSPPCPDAPGSCTKDNNYGGAGNHRDPGVHWNWCQYTEIIGNGARCKCNDAYTHFNCSLDRTERIKCSDGVNVVIDHCADMSCVVMPIGEDDVCTIEATTSSSSSSGGGAGGSGGAGGAGGSTDGKGGAGGSVDGTQDDTDSGCATAPGEADRSLASIAALLALAAITRRRARSAR